MEMETLLAQAGNRRDPLTGSITCPVYQTATFAHPALGESTGYDYTRSGNPTRKALEEAIAQLEGGQRGLAFATGMAAITTVLSLFQPGDHLVLCQDIYGGTYRLMEKVFRPWGLTATYVNAVDGAIEAAVQPNTKAVFIETPTNPSGQVYDIAAVARCCRQRGLLLIVDNTFMSPYLQTPIAHGADIVVHSGTKYLGGHNDTLAGLVVAATAELGDRLYYYQNAVGAVIGPWDAWLILRGLKTLALRLDRAQENALVLAKWLAGHPAVEKVNYLGLDDHPGREIHFRQAKGAGAMVAFTVKEESKVPEVLARIQLISFAESLGGVETLLTFPAQQTHADIPEEIRAATGVNRRMLRLSVGIENVQDLIADLAGALAD
ncbi:trans-sulfuration enzyme family protein [Heliophilum fasciatum]|uniref:Cysteine synthase /cystathionine gamma-synthase n=1 Tax=Heliophilum fasciatum TaxID=35700 RepID=A0A4R2RWX7_9FIRM|nr:PLP-dependent aspartate aminotransferase family protein [Heliophilum fasciatum]MCW2276645.1 cystathionine gamma-synthase [Heliophilum fasciatum]TCP68972.1 cysteine synthase /cystathionine gamma-synthase [Heliophilum fasciatum]